MKLYRLKKTNDQQKYDSIPVIVSCFNMLDKVARFSYCHNLSTYQTRTDIKYKQTSQEMHCSAQYMLMLQ